MVRNRKVCCAKLKGFIKSINGENSTQSCASECAEINNKVKPTTFVHEDIPEEDLERAYSFKTWNPINIEPIKPKRWTIDRERDIILISVGGQGLHILISQSFGYLYGMEIKFI